MLYQPFFAPASIILLLALPLLLDLIPPNCFYGVRTPATLADQRCWYDTNRYAGWTLVGASLFYLAIAVFWPSTNTGATDFGRWLLHLGGFVGPLLVSLLLIRKYLRRFYSRGEGSLRLRSGQAGVRDQEQTGIKKP